MLQAILRWLGVTTVLALVMGVAIGALNVGIGTLPLVGLPLVAGVTALYVWPGTALGVGVALLAASLVRWGVQQLRR